MAQLDPQNVRLALELGAGLIAVMGTGFVLAERLISRRSLDLRAIQFLALIMFAPLILIMALEHVIDGGAAAALVGAIAGFLLADLRQPSAPSPPHVEPVYSDRDGYSQH